MDAVSEIKARLPIEELVAKYCQIQKKGRSFVSLCPFHSDSRPSLLISPDKGIAYCFSCQTGGDIFSFYQAIESVDFRQALKDLAERAGVIIESHAMPVVQKDEKERIRECLIAAHEFFQKRLASHSPAVEYLQKRGVAEALREKFALGFAPDSFSETYEHLLKVGFSRKEILQSGLGVQRELQEERIYDRFRNRLMFPIHDTQGNLIAFGGRTLGEDDAKYINSSEGALYHKSSVLFGLHHSREAIRTQRKAIVVEGYFDVLACHQVGIEYVVATSGTALTQEHAKLLRRYADTVILCLDQDRAGEEACERAFPLLSKEGLFVRRILLPEKDPGELVQSQGELLRLQLQDGGESFLDCVLQSMEAIDMSQQSEKRLALMRILPLIRALQMKTEQEEYLEKAAKVFRTSLVALRDDLQKVERQAIVPREARHRESPKDVFSKCEITLGIFFLYPQLKQYLVELIEPEEGIAAALYAALKVAPDDASWMLDALSLPDNVRERAAILVLFCEQHGFADWSESLALREIRKNCSAANRELLLRKQQEISRKLLEAHQSGKHAEEIQLQTQYQELLKIAKMTTS